MLVGNVLFLMASSSSVQDGTLYNFLFWEGADFFPSLAIHRVRVILQNEQEWDVEIVVYEGANDNGFIWEVSVVCVCVSKVSVRWKYY